MEAEGLGGRGGIAPAFRNVQVASVLDSRDDRGADGGQVGGPTAGPAGGSVFAEQTLEALYDRCNPGGYAERAVTKMLCAVDGHLGRSLARIFLDLRGLPVNENAEMIDPKDYADPPGSHAPDVAVRDAAANKLLLAVEGKRDARINFAERCPCDTEACNQVICYPRDCWTSPATLEGTSFLWLHPQDTNPWASAWHEGHLGNKEHEESAGGPDRLRHLVDNQRAAIAMWRTATWEDLVTRVQALQDPAADVIATIISTWTCR